MKLLNEILGTKYPIIQGGMANIATGEFAAACSNAGALGIIGAGGMNADTLRENIRRCKQLTDKPFGVNIMLMHPQADEFAQIVVEEGVQVVTTGAGNPGKYVPMWKAAGIKVIPVVAAALLNAKDSDTIVTGRIGGSPVRVLKNRMSREYVRQEKAGADKMELEKYTLGSLRRAVFEGDTSTGSLMAGQVAGMLHEVRPVADILDDLWNGGRQRIHALSEEC